jgi:UDP-2-acetamido-2-deoxy-ribo-hexuluronate aminotransferase
VHLQKGYTEYGFKAGDMPKTESLTSQVLSLPMHTELTEDQLQYIVEHVIRFIKG